VGLFKFLADTVSDSKVCPFCGALNDPEAKVCYECFMPLSEEKKRKRIKEGNHMRCVKCGAELEDETIICPMCGEVLVSALKAESTGDTEYIPLTGFDSDDDLSYTLSSIFSKKGNLGDYLLNKDESKEELSKEPNLDHTNFYTVDELNDKTGAIDLAAIRKADKKR